MGPEWIVIGTVVALLFGGVGAAAVGASKRGRSYQDGIEALWARTAETIGGRLEVVSRKSLEPRVLRLVVERDDATATAILSVPVTADAEAHTKARALFVLGTGPRFVARPRLVSEPAQIEMPSSLRAVQGNAGAAMTPEVRTLADSIRRGLTIRSDGTEVDVVWDGAESDPAVIDAALQLVAAIARHGADHLRGLSTIDDATYEARSDEGPRVRVRRGLVDVRLLVRPGDDQPVYLARVDARDGTPEVDTFIGDGGALGEPVPEGLLGPEVEPELARVAPARLETGEGRIEIVWREAPSLDQAKAAVRILSAVGASAGSRGAFR
ncbi:MAG: hypothetical protein H6719_13520 [Sandaracinaceae bacterium]|nr:hypothetical protein [Sandaracinaceae bacterium]